MVAPPAAAFAGVFIHSDTGCLRYYGVRASSVAARPLLVAHALLACAKPRTQLATAMAKVELAFGGLKHQVFCKTITTRMSGRDVPKPGLGWLQRMRDWNPRGFKQLDSMTGFFRLEPLDIYYVSGFGVMGWVTAEDYRCARVDPLADAAPGILGHMNSDHVPAMILLAKVHAGLDATEATMTAVDRLGFYLRLKTADGMKGTRINFQREVQNSDEASKVVVEMVRAAKPKA